MLFSRFITAACLALIVFCINARAEQQRPNVLWIVSEDNSTHWLGCYGNAEAHTPRLDAFAAESILFEHAYSNAPVCAVARAGLLHGMYSVTLGTQHMRSRHAIPRKFKPYVSYLREAGYYCTNASKTDYNRKGDDKAIWDACGHKAHYKNRQPDQPFFAIFNDTVSHESSLFAHRISGARKQGLISEQPRLDPEALSVPPYLPDLPEVRSDIAIYHDVISALDERVGRILEELADRGLSEETIVFYYSDHGGILPRGKRYLKQTGVNVPLLVHFPEKWQHLSTFASAQRTDELVAFVDFAPTLLSLCGITVPDNMQGRPFLGPQRAEPSESPIVFLFADRFDEKIGMRRGLTDGRYKYIRRFMPHLPASPYSSYQFGQAAWRAWQTAWQEGMLPDKFSRIWEAPQVVEELFDLSNDPWEINNLAGDPQHAGRLKEYQERLREQMIATRDTGIIPEAMFLHLAQGDTINEYAQSEEFEYESALEVALLASASDPENLLQLRRTLTTDDPVIRYWAALGCGILGKRAEGAIDQIAETLSDEFAAVRIAAAEALYRSGEREQGSRALQLELGKKLTGEEKTLLLNTMIQLGLGDQVPTAWLNRHEADGYEYVRRLTAELLAMRQP